MFTDQDIAKKIQDVRIHNNLSQEALGKLFQTSKQAVCSWEKGRNQPSIIKFMQLLELDGANVQELFGISDTSSMPLSKPERQLLLSFRSLTADQQQMILSMVKAL